MTPLPASEKSSRFRGSHAPSSTRWKRHTPLSIELLLELLGGEPRHVAVWAERHQRKAARRDEGRAAETEVVRLTRDRRAVAERDLHAVEDAVRVHAAPGSLRGVLG